MMEELLNRLRGIRRTHEVNGMLACRTLSDLETVIEQTWDLIEEIIRRSPHLDSPPDETNGVGGE